MYSPGYRHQVTPRRWSTMAMSGLVHATVIGAAILAARATGLTPTPSYTDEARALKIEGEVLA
jgi:hypothetical protein